MSQRSITSYFTRKTTSNDDAKSKSKAQATSATSPFKVISPSNTIVQRSSPDNENDSPIKPGSRKRRLRIDSSSSDDNLSNDQPERKLAKTANEDDESSTSSSQNDKIDKIEDNSEKPEENTKASDGEKNSPSSSSRNSTSQKKEKRTPKKIANTISSSESSASEDEKPSTTLEDKKKNKSKDKEELKKKGKEKKNQSEDKEEKTEPLFKTKLKTYSNKKNNKKNDGKKLSPSPSNKSPKNKKVLSSSDEDIKKQHSEDEAEKEEEKDDNKKEKKNTLFGSTSKKSNIESEKSKSDGGKNYNPQETKYHPIKDACWKEGEKVPFLALARTLEEIEAVPARLKMIEILSNYLRSVIVLSPQDLLPSIYLCLNKLGPAYLGLELGVAEMSLMKALAQSFGRSLAQVRAEAAATGDLGLVAEQSRSSQRMMFQPAPLTVKGVFDRLTEIAKLTGNASQTKKMDKIQSTLVACRHSEARYLIRLLAGKLRIGLAEQSVLQALALACTLTPPNQTRPFEQLDASKGVHSDTFKSKYDANALLIKTHYCECPNYDRLLPVILEHGVAALPEHCRLEPGLPLKPMLAHPTKGVQEVLQRFDGLTFTCEWKYDGERAQIHLLEDGNVKIYSRNQEDHTSKYPDIISRIKHTLDEKVTSCILDCEAVAWDRESKQILPFQILSTRKRKDADASSIKVQVCVYMFDLLYLNGTSMIREPLQKRRELLRENFKVVDDEWAFATSIDATGMDEVQEFLDEAVKNKCEGLMVKTLEQDATYEIAKRSHNWLKLKKDYLEGIGDTLDLVVIGGYLGKGKRTGLYGGFLLACYDQENEEFQSICKIGTGFSDEILQKHSEFLREHLIDAPKSYYRFDSSHEPDHWFDACQVWEVKCADLSLSPVHRAALGIVDPEKGISLRFPRFLRIREDKTIEQATSATQVANLYENQDQIKNQQQKSSKSIEEDFY